MSSPEIQQMREQFLAQIIKEAYSQQKILLSSGKESDYYIDLRRVTLTPHGAMAAASLILDKVKNDLIDAIGGPTLGADPMLGAIAVLSLRTDTPMNTFVIRKTPKKYGKQQLVEGPLLKKGSRVVLIDDVATTGKALVESIDVLRHQSLEVVKAVCLVDRDEGAAEAVAQKEVELVSIYKAAEIHK